MKELLAGILPWYLGAVNLAAFLSYAADKRKAVKERWRTPERTLLTLAALGGGVGALLGMKLFHHKTRKWRFRLLVPFFTLAWAALCGWLWSLG